MSFGVSYTLDEKQFWNGTGNPTSHLPELQTDACYWIELDEIVRAPCTKQNAIDSALKSYLNLTAHFAPQYLTTDYGWVNCAFKLLESPLFKEHKSHVRRRMCGRLRKEQPAPRLQLVATVLLYDGRQDQKVFEQMQGEGLFVRLVGLLRERKESDPLMWWTCLELLYEMSRIQMVRSEDLGGYCCPIVKGHWVLTKR